MMKKRKQWIIPGIQVKYLRLLVVAMLLPTLLIGALLYYLILNIIAEEIAFPEAIASILFPAIHKINIVLLVGVPILFLILIGWGIMLSHRFAGPVYRLEKELDKIAGGDYSVRIKFRKNDDLKRIADAVNKVLDKLQHK